MLTSFSIGNTQSACSLSSFIANTLLYGDVMTSSSRDGYTEVTNLYTSGNSSSSTVSKNVPRPDPVPRRNKEITTKPNDLFYKF